MPDTHATSTRSSAAANGSEPFLFLYFSQLANAPVVNAISGEGLGKIRDFVVKATSPYPVIAGVRVRTPRNGDVLFAWSAVSAVTPRELFLDPARHDGEPAWDYSIRHDLLRQLAVEVSATTVVRIWDLHFVYAENKMVLAHAETGIRGMLRALGLEKPAMALLGGVLKTALRERFATFRHLQVLRPLPDGTIPIPKRILEMHPADLQTVLRQLPGGLRRPVFLALTDDAAAAVLLESTAGLRHRLLGDCPRERRPVLQKLMASPSRNQPL